MNELYEIASQVSTGLTQSGISLNYLEAGLLATLSMGVGAAWTYCFAPRLDDEESPEENRTDNFRDENSYNRCKEET